MKLFFYSCMLVLTSLSVSAETVYITDQLKAGLHEDKSLDSAILKVVATGTRLEVIKQEEQLSFVRDASGTSGWIGNQYLMTTAPDNASLGPLQARADNLENRLNESREKNLALEKELKRQGKVLPEEVQELKELKIAHAELQQQFNAQKLKAGELQVEITELRNRVGQDADSETLYRQIKTLEEDKKKLEIQLLNTLEKYDADAARDLALAGETGGISRDFRPDLRNMLIYLLITLVLGLFAGAYLLDLINRRRHGGFRI